MDVTCVKSHPVILHEIRSPARREVDQGQSGDTTPCRMTGVTLHSWVHYEEIRPSGALWLESGETQAQCPESKTRVEAHIR